MDLVTYALAKKAAAGGVDLSQYATKAEVAQVRTYKPFPSGWDAKATSSYTTKQFCDTVNADSNAVEGTVFLGEIKCSDLHNLPGGVNLVNGEAVVEIIKGTGTSGKTIHISLTSGNRTPYRWEYTYWNNGSNVSGWKGFQPLYDDGIPKSDLSAEVQAALEGKHYVIAGQKEGTTLGTKATAEGYNTTSSNIYTHAEGTLTEATGSFSHAEGANTKATSSAAHAEGRYTEANNTAAHAEGDYSIATATYSHAEGTHTKAYGMASHAEGSYSTAFGASSHAEGYSDDHVGYFSIFKTNLAGRFTVTQWPEKEELYNKYNIVYLVNNDTKYYGYIDAINIEDRQINLYFSTFPSLESLPDTAINLYVIGAGAYGDYSHVEGYNTIAIGDMAHAEGEEAIAEGFSSHAEGTKTIASGFSAHAEGEFTQTSGHYSHSEGYHTIANHKCQHVFGEYNEADTSVEQQTERGDYVEIVGNGTSENNRSNARTLDWYGNEVLNGKLTVGSAGITIGNTTITEAQLQALLAMIPNEEEK